MTSKETTASLKDEERDQLKRIDILERNVENTRRRGEGRTEG